MKERFLVEDYSEGGTPKVKIVYLDDLWKIIQEGGKDPPKIAVSKIGECIIDWS